MRKTIALVAAAGLLAVGLAGCVAGEVVPPVVPIPSADSPAMPTVGPGTQDSDRRVSVIAEFFRDGDGNLVFMALYSFTNRGAEAVAFADVASARVFQSDGDLELIVNAEGSANDGGTTSATSLVAPGDTVYIAERYRLLSEDTSVVVEVSDLSSSTGNLLATAIFPVSLPN